MEGYIYLIGEMDNEGFLSVDKIIIKTNRK